MSKPDLAPVIAGILKTLESEIKFNTKATEQFNLVFALIAKLENRIEKLEKENGK